MPPVLPAGGPLDDKHLLPEVSTLFMAGFESESALLFGDHVYAFSREECAGAHPTLASKMKQNSVGWCYPYSLLKCYVCAAVKDSSASQA